MVAMDANFREYTLFNRVQVGPVVKRLAMVANPTELLFQASQIFPPADGPASGVSTRPSILIPQPISGPRFM